MANNNVVRKLMDQWVEKKHGDIFPSGAVRALERGLGSSDLNLVDSYVALWYKNGEAIFGRAHNVGSKVEAIFSHGGHEYHSRVISRFYVLCYTGHRGIHGFVYRWKPVAVLHINKKYHAMRIGDRVPAVLNVGKEDEILGYANLTNGKANSIHMGQDTVYQGEKYLEAYVLCKKYCV